MFTFEELFILHIMQSKWKKSLQFVSCFLLLNTPSKHKKESFWLTKKVVQGKAKSCPIHFSFITPLIWQENPSLSPSSFTSSGMHFLPPSPPRNLIRKIWKPCGAFSSLLYWFLKCIWSHCPRTSGRVWNHSNPALPCHQFSWGCFVWRRDEMKLCNGKASSHTSCLLCSTIVTTLTDSWASSLTVASKPLSMHYGVTYLSSSTRSILCPYLSSSLKTHFCYAAYSECIWFVYKIPYLFSFP